MRAQTSLSGPYWGVVRQAVQVVDVVQASWLELTLQTVLDAAVDPVRPAARVRERALVRGG